MATPEVPTQLSEIIATITAIAPFFLAFSMRARDLIRKRAGYKSEISGEKDYLEASHLDHNRKNPLYDDPSNGHLVTIYEHLQEHIEREGMNGLSFVNNRWAIARLKERIKIVEEKGSHQDE